MPTTPTAAPPRGAPVWAGMLVLYLVWGSTYLGDRDRGRDASRRS